MATYIFDFDGTIADSFFVDLVAIMEKLNNRPRKSLGYTTPNEVFSSG